MKNTHSHSETALQKYLFLGGFISNDTQTFLCVCHKVSLFPTLKQCSGSCGQTAHLVSRSAHSRLIVTIHHILLSLQTKDNLHTSLTSSQCGEMRFERTPYILERRHLPSSKEEKCNSNLPPAELKSAVTIAGICASLLSECRLLC